MRSSRAFPPLRNWKAAMAACLFAIAAGAVAAPRESSPQSLAARERWVAALRSKMIAVSFNRTPIAEAVETIAKKTGVPVRVLLQDQPSGAEGLDPALAIDLEARDKPALHILEQVLQQASDAAHVECRWQTTAGGIEAGPKSRLLRGAAMERRAYSITDLGFHASDFSVPPLQSSGSGGTGGGSSGGAGGGSGSGGAPPPFTPSQNEARYKRIKSLVQATVEPDVWAETSGGPCTIEIFDDKLIVTCPDFVHRAISSGRAAPSANRSTTKPTR